MATNDISILYADRKREVLAKAYERIHVWKEEIAVEAGISCSTDGQTTDSQTTALQFFNAEGHRVALGTSPTFAVLERIATYKKSSKYSPEAAIQQLARLEKVANMHVCN